MQFPGFGAGAVVDGLPCHSDVLIGLFYQLSSASAGEDGGAAESSWVPIPPRVPQRISQDACVAAVSSLLEVLRRSVARVLFGSTRGGWS